MKQEFPVHLASKIPVKYQKNVIMGETHRAKKIETDFIVETK